MTGPIPRYTLEGVADAEVSVHAFPTEDGLGLSACQGILQEHHGLMSRERCQDGAMLLRVELPATETVPAKAKQSKDATVPALWRSRPSA